jgi:dihydropteroate synthase
MGVVNTTPDSFSDGGTLYRGGRLDLGQALSRAVAMVDQGAAIVDIGGESTRPGARAVSAGEEMDRVLPLVERIAAELDVVISVDTSNPDLMREAAQLGAGMLNDVRALSRPGALAAAAASGLPVCLMHMQGEPGTMQSEPSYQDVVREVADFLQQRVADCARAGIARERLLLDPGFGFGKTVGHNLGVAPVGGAFP